MQSKTSFIQLAIPTGAGTFAGHYSRNGLAQLDFPDPARPVKGQEPHQIPDNIRVWHRLTGAAIKSILSGREPGRLPPLDPAGTDFQKSVWHALRRIPWSKTKSYGEIAQAIGKPKALRAVGGACGANPIPILIPCHRVLAAKKGLGGFSSGLNWKRLLLAREGMYF